MTATTATTTRRTATRAHQNLSKPAAAPLNDSDRYQGSDAFNDLALTDRATAVIKLVGLAIRAQDAMTSTPYEGESFDRWWPLVASARALLERVKDTNINKVNSFNIDWVPSLTMLEALDASMCLTSQTEGLPAECLLSFGELVTLCDAALESLAELREEIQAVVHDMSQADAALH